MKLSELAQICEAKLDGDGDHEVTDVARIEDARRTDVCFVADKKYLSRLEKSKPGVVIAPPGMALPQGMYALRHNDPDFAFSKALTALRGEPLRPTPGIGENVVVGENFDMGDNASIGAFSVMGVDVKIGRNTIIYPHCYIGDGVTIGDDCVVYPHVTILERCKVGNRCILHPGAVIGADGFGFHFVGGKFVKAPQRGIVEIQDDVEIGANSAVDRARFDVTRIRAGTKIDNLVQIGHNVDVGNHCVIAGLAGIGGSAVIKEYVQIGGQTGIADHITIGMGAKIAAKSGVMQDVQPGMKLAGQPAYDGREFMRREGAIRKLPELVAKIRDLEGMIKDLEKTVEEGSAPGLEPKDDEPAPGPNRKTGIYRPKPLSEEDAK